MKISNQLGLFVRLEGLSQGWGKGGQLYPSLIEDLEYGRSLSRFKACKLDYPNLSKEKYFQYKDDYSRNPEKFIIHDLDKNILKCISCNDESSILNPCSNCNNRENLTWSNDKLFCYRCKMVHQQSRWICSKCSCNNSIGNTLFHEVELFKFPNNKELINAKSKLVQLNNYSKSYLDQQGEVRSEIYWAKIKYNKLILYVRIGWLSFIIGIILIATNSGWGSHMKFVNFLTGVIGAILLLGGFLTGCFVGLAYLSEYRTIKTRIKEKEDEFNILENTISSNQHEIESLIKQINILEEQGKTN